MVRAVLFVTLCALARGASASCHDYYAASSSVAAKRWCDEGNYFNYTSIYDSKTYQIFYRCSGDPKNSAIFMGHGWPTSSFDFQRLTALLDEDFYICAVDYIGHGFSDKPSDATYKYSMFEHARVVETFLTDIVPLKSFTYLGHDEGDSVAFIFLSEYEQMKKPYTMERIIILNGGIYLPLQNIKTIQKALLSNVTGPAAEKLMQAKIFAAGLGSSVYKPKLSSDEVAELATVFDYQTGCHVLHGTVQYLNERWKFEDDWLAMLGRSSVPATMIWGDSDPAATLKEGQYVWDNFLSNRTTAPAKLHVIKGASHYVHVDHAEAVASIVRDSLVRKAVISI